MNKVVIYPNPDNSITIVYPTGELPVEVIAVKDTPAGLPYKIVDKSSLPEEHNVFFNAWQSDFTNPDGYGIGQQAWFIQQYQKELLTLDSTQQDKIDELNQKIAIQQSEMQ